MPARRGLERRRDAATRARRAVAVLALLAVSAGCGGPNDSAARLGDRTGARLTAGVGLGDVRLGETTLGAFAERFGDGTSSLFAGDRFGVELTFEGNRLGFLFVAEGPALERMASSRMSDLARSLRPISEFLRAYPECAGMRLHSVHVAVGARPDSSLYTGATERGVRLGSTEVDVLTAYGRPNDVRGLLVSGSEERDDEYRTAAYFAGIQFYLRAPRDGGSPVVEKIAIFPPGDPTAVTSDR